MKIEKIEKEIAKLESQISILKTNHSKNVHPTTLREIDAKIHAAQKSIDAKKALIAHLKREQKKDKQQVETVTLEVEKEAEEAKEEVKEEVKLEPKKVVKSEEEILLEEIAALELDIEQLKLNKMRIRRQATIDEINEKIKQKDKQIAAKKARISMLKFGAKKKPKEVELETTL